MYFAYIDQIAAYRFFFWTKIKYMRKMFICGDSKFALILSSFGHSAEHLICHTQKQQNIHKLLPSYLILSGPS